MKRLLSCEFNFDTVCVELKFSDGTMIAIDTIAVENEVADNMYQRSELDYLIYNDPIAYADLILNGNPEAYLKAVTEYNSLDWFAHAPRSYWGVCLKMLHINVVNFLQHLEKNSKNHV